MNELDGSRIQGLLATGFGGQRAACYVLLRITDAPAARQWLADAHSHVTYCNDRGTESKLNLAFTHDGLLELIGPDDELSGLAPEFVEGMVTEHRSRVLGDLIDSPSDPRRWQWGGPTTDPVHVLVMVFELNADALQRRLDDLRDGLRGLQVVRELHSTWLLESKEHFGFRDGIGRVGIDGLHGDRAGRDQLAAGEFVLGYPDQTGGMEPAPRLARNSSYLVFRQIAQDVEGFWSAFPDASDAEKVRRAAMMVGRWPDGTPLALSPDPPTESRPTNEFEYRFYDRDGVRCPFGSHIRRANPRDTLLSNPAKSMNFVNRHRLLRRGRAFGLPADPAVYPGDLQVQAEEPVTADGNERGIYFICLNASLARQFEFCQQTWMNNPKFHDLGHETDAIGSSVQWSGPGQRPVFSEATRPLRQRHFEPGKFVRTTGGAYFLLPGRSLLQRLTSS